MKHKIEKLKDCRIVLQKYEQDEESHTELGFERNPKSSGKYQEKIQLTDFKALIIDALT